MEKIVLYNPRILGIDIEDLKLKLKLFHDLGLSYEEIAKMMSGSPLILNSSTPNKIIPSLSVLQGLLGSDSGVVRLLRKCVWFITSDLEKTLRPNLETLKSFGIPMEHIIHLLYTHPRYLLVKGDNMRKSIERTIEIGVPQSSKAFLKVATAYGFMSEGMWEVKLQILRDLGFSDNDALTMFKKEPFVFLVSEKKMKKVIELLLATRKYKVSTIVNYPSVITCSIEKRIEPRLQILGVLESRNILIGKWPGLSRLGNFTDDMFLDRFVRPYSNEIGEECFRKIFGHGKTR